MAAYSQERIFWDINSQYDGLSDNCFNRLYPTAKTLVVVDGVSVKSEIGFDYRYLVNVILLVFILLYTNKIAVIAPCKRNRIETKSVF